MSMKFSGSYEDLKSRLNSLENSGEWIDLNENQKQFKHKSGSILNWYPSTGTINFQGKSTENLRNIVQCALTSPGKDQEIRKTACEDSEHVFSDEESSTSTGNNFESKDRLFEVEHAEFLGQKFTDSELVIGLVGAVGADLRYVIQILEDRFKQFNYESTAIRISQDVIPIIVDSSQAQYADEFERINTFMSLGNQAREKSKDNSILALGAAARIGEGRPTVSVESPPYKKRHAYIINSLKHPDEVSRLREIYSEGFFLIGVYASEKRRLRYLVEDKSITEEKSARLIERDSDEHLDHGQRTSGTFHLSDFFIHLDGNADKLKKSLWRTLDLIFGHPYITPTFDEYAMFMAFSAALRSADLSRQVGAIVAKNNTILSTGANDCPKSGGGLYWPEFSSLESEIIDTEDGRDYKRGQDSNKIELAKLIDEISRHIGLDDASGRNEIARKLKETRLKDITEYGRMVHAEMEALLSCARNSINPQGGTLYCTTFPCHNCAKHIVASGINRVVYVEPYPKSKAAEFHSDSIALDFQREDKFVYFEPFVGVGPRRFFDLFSMRLGSGYPLKRKDSYGNTLNWKQEKAKLRIQMLPCSYIERETLASSMFYKYMKELANED